MMSECEYENRNAELAGEILGLSEIHCSSVEDVMGDLDSVVQCLEKEEAKVRAHDRAEQEYKDARSGVQV